MSGFNMPPGVGVHDIPGNERTPPITPGRDNIPMEMHKARCAIRNGMGVPEHMVAIPPHCEECAPEFPCWNGQQSCRKSQFRPETPANNAGTQALEIARRIRKFQQATRGGYIPEYPTLESLLIVALTPLHVLCDNYRRSIERAHKAMDESGLIMDHAKSKQGLTNRVKSIIARAKAKPEAPKSVHEIAEKAAMDYYRWAHGESAQLYCDTLGRSKLADIISRAIMSHNPEANQRPETKD